MLYQTVLKPILFSLEPEFVHDRVVALGELLGRSALGRRAVGAFCSYEHPSLETEVCGLRFRNPVGLAAGFDKDVRLTQVMPAVGFGFMEVGAVTRLPSAGNPGRRLLRLPADRSLIVYYGLKNIGAEAVREKARALSFRIPTGVNVARTNRADVPGDAVEDYLSTYRTLSPLFSYATVNVSCPNVQGGCMVQDDPALLDRLLAALARERKSGPVFLKISNSTDPEGVERILDSVGRHPVIDGFVITNLAKDRSTLTLKSPSGTLERLPRGGISGKPIQGRSDELIRTVYRRTGGRYAIIGVGGVFTTEDAYRKIRAGASLVQLVTGMIYGGPLAIKEIKKGLAALLARDGYRNVAEAVGTEAA